MSNKILVVDDDPMVLDLMKVILDNYGYISITTDNSERAIELYKELKPSAIITDINMPKLGGIDFAKEILKYDKDAIIIFCSGTIVECEISEAEKLGMCVIPKPFDYKNVIRILKMGGL